MTAGARSSAGESGVGDSRAGRPRAWARAGSLQAFRHRDFAVFWTAALLSNSGSWMQQVTVPLVLFQMTGRGTWVGLAVFATLIPALMLSPVAGIVADRYDRRRVLIVTQVLMMLAATSLFVLWVTDQATPGRIVALLAFQGSCSGIQLSSWQSFVPLLVPRESLLDAVRLNSMQFNAARAFGPAVAGAVLGVFGPAAAFLTNAVSFLLVIGALLVVKPRTAMQPARERFSVQFREGLAYVRARPGLRLAVGAAGVTAMVGLATVSAAPAPFSEEVFHVGEGALGLLVAMVGVGGILGSAALLVVGDRVPRSQTARIGLTGYVVAVLALGLAPNYWMGLVAMMLLGAAHVTSAVTFNTSLQAQVHEQYRGRTLSLYVMAVFAGSPLGALLQGVLGDAIGRRVAVLIPATFFAAWLAWAVVRYQGFRALDASEPTDVPGREVPTGEASPSAVAARDPVGAGTAPRHRQDRTVEDEIVVDPSTDVGVVGPALDVPAIPPPYEVDPGPTPDVRTDR